MPPKREIKTLAIFSPPRMMISLTVYEPTKKKKERRFELNTKRSPGNIDNTNQTLTSIFDEQKPFVIQIA
jgi:hypothetical protein